MNQRYKVKNVFMFDAGSRRYALLGGVFLFRILLDLSYVFIISPLFSYSGLILNISPVKVIESYGAMLLLGFFIPCEVKKPSDFLVGMLFLLSTVPTLSFYAMAGESRRFLYMMLAGFLCVLLGRKIPFFKLGNYYFKDGYKYALGGALFFTVFVLYWLLHQGAWRYFNLDLTRVYEFREEVGGTINIGVFSYLNTWVFKVFNMALISWALYKKNRSLLISFLILQIIFFAISSHKSVLFYPLVVFVLNKFFYKKRVVNSAVLIMAGVIFASGMAYFLSGDFLAESLFVRRMFFVPAFLNFIYYDFFSQAGFVYMSNGLLGSIIDYPFTYSPIEMISYALLGHTDMNPNNGFLATAYMHFGMFGVIIFSLIVGWLMKIVDVLIRARLPIWFGLSLVIVPFVSLLTSADLSTALLTHGLAVSLIILWLFAISRPVNWDLKN